MIHTSGLLRVTDVIKDLRCGVVTIVTMLVDQRNDYSACSTLTCFRGFLHYDDDQVSAGSWFLAYVPTMSITVVYNYHGPLATLNTSYLLESE